MKQASIFLKYFEYYKSFVPIKVILIILEINILKGSLGQIPFSKFFFVCGFHLVESYA